MRIHSLDFMEFLWANGIADEQISYPRGFFEKGEMIPAEINERMLQLAVSLFHRWSIK